MKKFFEIVFSILVIAVGVYVIIFFINYNKSDTTQNNPNEVNEKENKNTEEEKKETNEEEPETKPDDKKYDQYLVASGFAGASDHAYYTKNNNLYHLIISKNQATLIAKGVDKIESDIGSILVYKGNDFKIVEEDEFLTYVD